MTTASDPLSFVCSIDLPDGRHVYVSIEVPARDVTGLPRKDVSEHAEVAQIGATTVLNCLLRGDAARQESPF